MHNTELVPAYLSNRINYTQVFTVCNIQFPAHVQLDSADHNRRIYIENNRICERQESQI